MRLQSSDFDISRHELVQVTVVSWDQYSFGLFCMSYCPAAGLIEIREFMARFVDQVPNLEDLEAAFADPTHSQHHMQVTFT